jgi:hypothetical protein
MPLYPDVRPFKPEQESVFDSPVTQAINTFLRWTGLSDPQDQVMALMNPMETGASGGLVGALQKVARRIQNPIKAYHGSPHDFDQFSMDKIGTGEGAQAYGHGLYFAEKPGVAETYKGVQGRASVDPAANIASKTMAAGADPAHRLKTIYPDMSPEDIAAAIERATNVPPGKMYEVNIHADPDQLLDWDKPLSQQSEKVQGALGYHNRPRNFDAEMAVKPGSPEEKALYRELDTRIGSPGVPDVTGGQFYREDVLRQTAADEASRTEWLKSKGIPGIKYLDGGSRAAGEGSRNYVIWDDSMIEVLKKYGIALPVIEGLRREAMANGGRVELQ